MTSRELDLALRAISPLPIKAARERRARCATKLGRFRHIFGESLTTGGGREAEAALMSDLEDAEAWLAEFEL